jgi:oligopeptide/dipeptide ABC transporter ATP-binding protein
VGYLSDRVAVMYLGQIIEFGPTIEVYRRPRHPYTMALMSAVPSANPLERRERIVLTGEIPSPIEPPNYCRLVSRCPFAMPECSVTPIQLWEVGPDHRVACIRSVRGEIPIPEYEPGEASPLVAALVAVESKLDGSRASVEEIA